jgi:hypothetical protein
MRLRLILAGALAITSIAAVGCDEALSDLTGPTPDLKPTFSSIQSEIFNKTDASGRLACTNCHNPGGSRFTAGLDLTASVSYANLVGVASTNHPGAVRVVAGDPENSYIIHKLEGRTDIAGVRMPRGNGPFLTAGQMTVIKRWIALGARND